MSLRNPPPKGTRINSVTIKVIVSMQALVYRSQDAPPVTAYTIDEASVIRFESCV